MSEKIIEQIKKLRALSTSSNEHEAAAAAKAAAKLCEKHRISEVDLVDQELIIMSDTPVYETGKVILWKDNLSSFISRHYGCSIFVHGDRSNGRKYSEYRIVGKPSDLKIVHYMFGWLSSEIERLTKQYGKGKGHIFCSSYAFGMVKGIQEQMTIAKQEARQEEVHQANALVKIDARLEEATKTMNKMFKLNTSNVKTSSQLDPTAFAYGKEKGLSLQITKAIA